ncbi:coiled-coil domain-containing protein [Nonomuraea sp. CA-143628]|uniref:coiled-coil domain-containing protein n=1 Tax=Nonomuraea sp. CA-143628 TaxID=3239997 RepID=UPI003D8ED29C
MAAASPSSLAITLITTASMAFGAFTATPAAAAPKPSEAQLRAELKQLDKKVDKLIETYNLKRVELAKAKQDSETTKKRLATAEAQLVTAQKRVTELARLQYQNGTGALPNLTLPTDASSAALLDHLAAEQQAVVQGVATARDEKKAAADQATALEAKIREDAANVAKQRDDAQGVIKDIQKKLKGLIPFGPGRRSDGSWAPELPSGTDNITARMRVIRGLIQKDFALPYEVGCFRSDGGGGEHPLGRACDFMMSTGGSMPSAANQALGDRVAAWALENKDKLGVKYVIWKQRINQGSGWSSMSDRGSITQNHLDHVHISMF